MALLSRLSAKPLAAMHWIASVNQDSGIAPDRKKGAAVHLVAMRKAFTALGFRVTALDDPDGGLLQQKLTRMQQDQTLDLIYERYALGRDCAARFAQRHALPLVLEVNAPLAHEQARYRDKPETPDESEKDRFVFANATLVVAVSSAVAKYAMDRGAGPDKIIICPNGIDQDFFNISVRTLKQALPSISESATVLGFHGRERPWHGFDDLVWVASRLLDRGHDIHFLVIGEGGFEALKVLPRSTYTRLEWQPHELIPGLLAHIDILPIAHRPDAPYYFSPLKLTEAMACGIVPVVPDLGDLATTVRHGKTGLVYPAGQTERLVEAISSLCTAGDLRVSMGNRAAAWAAEQTWTGIARRIVAHPSLAACGEASARVKSAVHKPNWRGFRAALLREMPGADETSIRKLEISKKGELLAQLHAGPEPLWVRWNGQRIEELRPAADDRIPLAALLREREADTTLEILSYRPGRRLVLLENRHKKPWVIKGYRKGHATPAFFRYEAAHRAFSGHGIRAPEVIDLDESLESLILVYEEGVPLDLSRGSTDVFYRIGESLADFQDRPTDIDTATFTSADELAVIDRFIVKIAAVGLDLPPNWESLRARLGVAKATLPAVRAGLCHRDLYDKQFTYNGDYITLLDFDLLCRADVTLDPANFLAHMVLRQYQGTQAATETDVDRCGKQFLKGLGRNAEPGFWERLRFYEASSFCRLALVYTLRPCWATLVPALVRMGERCLDDLRRIQSL